MSVPKKRGRPRKPPQEVPLFLQARDARVDRTVSISPKVAADLDAYVAWASARVGMPQPEALFRMFNLWIADFIRRDGLYQRERRAADAARGADAPVDP